MIFDKTQLSKIQPKLKIGQPKDRYEQEADAVADQVMKMPASQIEPIQRKCDHCEEELQMRSLTPTITPIVQKQEEEEEVLQMKGKRNDTSSTSGLESSLQNSKGSGQSMDSSTQLQMSRGIGADFSKVKVHTDSNAIQMNQQLNARAFTNGFDVYFNQGQYNPKSSEGKHLLAHELTHVVQQSGDKSTIQRSALASWEEATDIDRTNMMDKKTQRKYSSQQEKLKEGKKIKEKRLIQLPSLERILRVTANYHHFTEFPTNDPERPIQLDNDVIKKVEEQFRMKTQPDFFPNITWIDDKGNPHPIGVRFDINFIPHKPLNSEQDPDYLMHDNPLNLVDDVAQNPWDNFFLLQHIDRITSYGAYGLEAFLAENNISTITFPKDKYYEEAVFTPDGGGTPQIFALPDQQLDLKRIIRQEYLRLGGSPEALRTNPKGKEVLGRGNSGGISVDPRKTAIDEPIEFNRYEKIEGEKENYRKYNLDKKFDELTQFTYPPEERNKRIAAVIAHEIGHNIGMTHSDLGIMSESAEANLKMKFQSAIYDIPNVAMGKATVDAWEVKYQLGIGAVQHENVQSLVDRIRSFTTEMPQVRDTETGILSDKSELWSQLVDTLKGFLATDDFQSIFANPVLISMLSLPFENDMADELVQNKTISSEDKTIIQRMAKNRAMSTINDWNALSITARDYIKAETLRLPGAGGYTYFETPGDMNVF